MAEEIIEKSGAVQDSASKQIAPDTMIVPQTKQAEVVAPKSSEPGHIEPLRFEFTGTGAEYFRIWVVNLLLTILTVGVYSAWAKVRRVQYFYRNTRFDGAVFDYHGNPKAILKGRILALVLLIAYKISFEVSAIATVVVALILAAIMPWLLSRSFRFKLANTSYRGVHFRFQGTVVEAYRTLILFPVVLTLTGLFAWSLFASYSKSPSISMIIMLVILVLVVMGGTVPLAHHLLKRYQHDHAYFGQMPFFYYGRAVDFFKIYGAAIGLVIAGSILTGLLGHLFAPLSKALLTTQFGWLFQFLFGLLGAYVLYLFARSYLDGRIQNLVWNNTEVGDQRFQSTASVRRLLLIHATNLLLITLTFGLFKPFAAVRVAKYRLENLTLIANENLDEILADPETDQAGALGQEAGDFFDIDIAI
ncbi:MAG: YjgN family protein [Burkholderiaceae bacterium]